MRHRIKAGKVGSFTPEKQKVEIEQLDDREVAEGVEEIFEEDSEFSNDDEALAGRNGIMLLTMTEIIHKR